jgi:hypothetical protein
MNQDHFVLNVRDVSSKPAAQARERAVRAPGIGGGFPRWRFGLAWELRPTKTKKARDGFFD